MQRSRLLLSMGVIFNCTCVPLVHAQGTPNSTADVTLEEIVVTAEKRAQNLQVVPTSIQVFSGDDLRAEGKKRIDEIMSGVVGVQSQSAEVGTSFYMRGIGADRNAGGQQAVTTFLDGVYVVRSETVRGGSVDLAQVEVLRGPQSTILGGSSLAGAVYINTNNPKFDYEANGTVEFGNYNKLSTEGILNVPLTDKQAIRFVFSTERRDAYISAGNGDSDLLNARLKYRYQFNDNVDLVVSASHQVIGGAGVTLGVLSYDGFWVPYQSCTQSGNSAAPYNCSDTTNSGAAGGYTTGAVARGNPPTYGHVDSSVTYLNRSNPWNDGFTESGWGHRVYYHTILNDYNFKLTWNLGFGTLTVIPAVENGTFSSADGDTASFYVQQTNKYDTRQIDAHLDSNAGATFQWLVGANYLHDETPGGMSFVTSPGQAVFGPCISPSGASCYSYTYAQGPQTTTAAYANGELPIVSTLRAIAGLRYTRDTKATQSNAGGFIDGDINGPSTPLVMGTEYSASWSKLTYTGGLEYDLRPQSMLYGKYSTGYQPGVVQAGGTATPSQTLRQLTLGIKNRFFENRLQVNIEAFDSLYHDRGAQSSIDLTRVNSLGGTTTAGSCIAPAGPPPTLLVGADYTCMNVGSQGLTISDLKSRGVDVEVSWQPLRTDRLDASMEYLKTKASAPVTAAPVTVASIIAAGGNAVIADPTADATALLAQYNAAVASFAGAPLQNAPEWSGNLTYQHDFPMGNGANLSPRINIQYKSSYYSAVQNLQGNDANGVPLSPTNPGPAEQKSYALYNAYLVWKSDNDKFTATGYVKNIENKPILLNFTAANGFRGASSVDLDAPRTFGLILSAKF